MPGGTPGSGTAPPAGTCVIIFVTAPNLRVARRLARGAVEAQLAACVNVGLTQDCARNKPR